LYNQGGTPVVGFSPQTQQGLDMATQRATNGSPVQQNANTYAAGLLNGDYLNSNPWLDQTFNRAAMGTRNQLASEFAGSGRDVGASQFLRGEQLNNLATGIYGGAYDAERNRMQQGLSMAPGLAQADYQDASMLANVGSQIEGLQREQAQQPGNTLDEYLARLQGFPGGTVTQSQPMQRNVLGGALGGAQAGAMLGPWGMLGGAVLGGLYG
jgi:hypothetical protein